MPQAIQRRPPKEGISDLHDAKSLQLSTLKLKLDAALAILGTFDSQGHRLFHRQQGLLHLVSRHD